MQGEAEEGGGGKTTINTLGEGSEKEKVEGGRRGTIRQQLTPWGKGSEKEMVEGGRGMEG